MKIETNQVVMKNTEIMKSISIHRNIDINSPQYRIISDFYHFYLILIIIVSRLFLLFLISLLISLHNSVVLLFIHCIIYICVQIKFTYFYSSVEIHFVVGLWAILHEQALRALSIYCQLRSFRPDQFYETGCIYVLSMVIRR